MDKYKLALVKQVVFPDLYMCDKKSTDVEALMSSMLRIGPIGLWEDFDVDFIVVNEEKDRECRVWEYDCDPVYRKQLRNLANIHVNQMKGSEFLKPTVMRTTGEISVDVDDVDWGKYDIVISINIAIPTRIVHKYTSVLWAHMSGESYKMIDKAYFGYDVALSQQTTGTINEYKKTLDFPYTYVSANTLERIAGQIDSIKINSVKKGMYAEVNCTQERPVISVPQLEGVSKNTGEDVIVHKQEIDKNLESMINAKYFVKWGGRGTRGNGVIESISLGTPVLINPMDLTHRQLIPSEAWITSLEELENKIQYYNANADAYKRLLEKERELVQLFCHDYPYQGLIEFMKKKKENNLPNRNIPYSELLDKVKYHLNNH